MENSQVSRENQEPKYIWSSKRNETQESSAMEDVKLGAIAVRLNVKVRSSDMSFDMQEHALRCTRHLLDTASEPHPNLIQLAMLIKKEFDSAYGTAWHCVVGTSFGSFVTHSAGYFIYFSIDSLSVLLFKTELELKYVAEKKEEPKALTVGKS